jgi:hypothetical protein
MKTIEKPEKIQLVRLEVVFSQPPDCCDCGDDQEMVVTTEDGGGGTYYLIETKRWAINDPAELTEMLARVQAVAAMLGRNTEEQ